jgi:glycosyltransferase involved in cell wall biosynthesis
MKQRLPSPQFETLMEKIRQLLQQDGINYIGMVLLRPPPPPLPSLLPSPSLSQVNNTRLLHAFATSAFLVYPTNYPETGCLTCLKAMAMGCIPITSRYTDSSLPHLIGSYDLGPSQPLTPNLTDAERRLWFQTHWIPSLEAAYVQQTSGGIRAIDQHRTEMMSAAVSNFTWRRIAKTFLQHQHQVGG